MKKSKECLKCGKCCRWFFISNPQSKDKEFINFLEIKGNKKFLNVLAIYNPCKYLDLKTNECIIHDKKPAFCRKFNCNNYEFKRFFKLLA